MSGKYQDLMLRKEKAGKKAATVQRKVDLVKFELTEDGEDILIVSGPYANKTLRSLWVAGPSERDYVVEKLWSTGDEKVIKVITSLVCD